MNPTGAERIGLWVWTVLVCLFILGPLIVIVAISLTAAAYISLPVTGFSLRWYADLMGRPEFLEAARNSIVLAVQATAAAILLGTPVAIAVTRYRFIGRGLINLVANSSLFIPLVMIGLAILIFFSTLDIGGPKVRLFVAHVSLTVPYVIRMVSTSLAGFDWNQEAAARNLGASPLRAFFEVILPQIMSGVIAGCLFALIVSFDNVGISIFLTGASHTTLPVELFAFATYDLTPMVAAASTVMIMFSAIFVLIIEWAFGVQRMISSSARSEERRQAAVA